MFEEDARDALIKYLGYVIPSEEPVAAQEPVVESAQVPPTSQPTITAEDLFAASPMSENLSEPESDKVGLSEQPEEKKLPVISEDDGWVAELKQSVIVGDFARAVDVCFKYYRYADALVVSTWGGADLAQQTTVWVWMSRDF